MNDYTPSRPMRHALDIFMHHVREEPFPDQPPQEGDESLSSEVRKAIALLRACDAGDAVPAEQPEPTPVPDVVAARAEPDPAIVKPYQFPALESAMPVPAEPASDGDKTPANDDPEPSIGSEPVLRKDDQPALPVAPPTPSLLAVQKTVTLKNARAGEDYSDILVLDDGRDIELVNAAGTGLRFDRDDWSFSGVPAEAGDFELKLKGKIGDRPAEITASLAVIADPKSLWTSLASDESDRFWKPDEAFALVAGQNLRMIAASKRGRSHAKSGGFREDDFALTTHGAWHIAAVADGAGSARFSRRGSRLAVETVTRDLPALIDQHLGADFVCPGDHQLLSDEARNEIAQRLYKTLVAASYSALEALQKQADELEEPVASLSTTLILVIARRFEQRWFVAAFSIGDGGAALLDLDSKSVLPLTAPDSGEYAGQTRFLAKGEFADPEAVTKRLRIATPERFTAIALMSDGITDPKLPTDTIFADPAAWAAFWSDDLAKNVDFSGPEEDIRAKFLDWLDFWSPGNHDDRTLAVLLPREGA